MGIECRHITAKGEKHLRNNKGEQVIFFEGSF